MKIGEAELERGNDGVYTYEVELFVTHLVTSTDVMTWNVGDDWSKEAIEGEFIDAEELGREPDDSNDEIEYVRYEVTRKERTQFTREIEVTDGSCRGDFDKARIKTILREEGIEPDKVQEISGGVEERTVFLHG